MADTVGPFAPWPPSIDAPIFRHVDWSQHPHLRKERREETCLYVIADERGFFVKIGIATNPKRRLGGLQTASPYKLRLAHISAPMGRKAAEKKESRIHSALSEYRAAGEWFACPIDTAINAIEADK